MHERSEAQCRVSVPVVDLNNLGGSRSIRLSETNTSVLTDKGASSHKLTEPLMTQRVSAADNQDVLLKRVEH